LIATMPARTDVFTQEKRSEVTSLIRGRGNKDTELALVALLRLLGITGWRRHYKIEGRPDIAFPKLKLAIFVDGCFWHSCPLHATKPKGNAEFWEAKLQKNRERDVLVGRTLRRRGWKVMRIWEHELRRKNLPVLIRRLKRRLLP
jgi:DNA mismatch endonuclease, patch repair protein